MGELAALRELQVDVLRISPQPSGLETVIEAFAASLRGDRDPVEAAQQINATLPYGACNGYWLGQPGLMQVDVND